MGSALAINLSTDRQPVAGGRCTFALYMRALLTLNLHGCVRLNMNSLLVNVLKLVVQLIRMLLPLGEKGSKLRAGQAQGLNT
jgi:hypothetical protein